MLTSQLEPSMSETPVSEEVAVAPSKPHIFKRLYQWVLHWAETPYGTPALALISFAESSFFPIPPDVLQIALSVSRPKRSFFYAAVSSVASVLGGILGWVIGFALWALVSDFFLNIIPGVNQTHIDTVTKLYQSNAFLAIFTAAFSIIPFKVFTLGAGICHVPLTTLIFASLLGRSLRFFLVATAIYFFGPRIKVLLDKYFEWAAILLTGLLILGIVSIKWLMH